MEYTQLGRTGLKASRLCLGTMNFGDVTNEATSFRILDEALENGISFIDTADVYGTEQSPDIKKGSGLSEEIIGHWLNQGGGVTVSFWLPSSISRWGRGRTIAGYQPTTFARPARTACAGSKPIISMYIRCTTSIVRRPGKRSGRPWKFSSSKARSFT